ncbi:MAG TPA: EamA family transporter, partial [Mycolicibacterium fallax]|nr:EamA family transporter [Mycolicibacterium fallax]
MIWALVSALGYGVSDFVGGIAARRVAALRIVLVSYPMSMLMLAVLAALVGGHISGPAVLWGALSGIG